MTVVTPARDMNHIAELGTNALAARTKHSDWIAHQLRILRQEWSLLTIHR